MLRAQDLAPHIPSLRRYAWVLARDTSDADDLVQDCLERAIGRLGSFRSDGELRSWLFAILHNLFVSNRRRTARRPTVGLDEVKDIGAAGNQEHSRLLRSVLDALDTLPVEQRSVLLLVGVEDLTYGEAAQVLGVPVGTVMSRLSRGRERLRQVLNGSRPREQNLKVVR